MPPTQESVDTFAVPPDPGQAGTLDDLVERLRLLKVWAGDPSYECIKDRINAAWSAAGRPAADLASKTTVVSCFRPGRRRLNPDLVTAVVGALHPDAGYVTQWRQSLQVIGGRGEAAAQVRVQDRLPRDTTGFIGRSAELDRLQLTLRHGQQDGGAVVISAIAGMAGVGKTQLAIRAGHLLNQEQRFDWVLFVDLRGFHPGSGQPPADPAAVLDGFLRVLGTPGQQIPYDLPARTAAYRRRLTGTRTLVILDNAADAEQVRPLLPQTPGCPVLVTSRRDLTTLHPATHIAVDVFTPSEALALLTRAAPGIPAGQDPHAAARIARRCGYLPLALKLVAAHMRSTPGWTLTDHADRLDERHHHRGVDTGIQLALDLSYQHLPADRQRLLRLVALHPGQDFGVHAAAALAGSDLATTGAHLRELRHDHLLQPGGPGRYTLHDLVRAYATGRAGDEDPPPAHRAALTRLFDFYLATAGAAMATLYPAETHLQPRVAHPGTAVPALTDRGGARRWLDTERPGLVAVAAHTAGHGWPAHSTRLSTILFKYLDGAYLTDALTVHGHARRAAQHTGDPGAQAHALSSLGVTHTHLGRYEPAAEHLQQALELSRQAGDRAGEARAMNNLGGVEVRLGRYRPAGEHYALALALFRQTGHRAGEAHVLNNLGLVESKLGRHEPATEHIEQALTLFRQLGDSTGGAWTLNSLGEHEMRLGRYGPATEHLQQALTLYRQLGNRVGEAWALDASGQHQEALTIFRETGERSGEASALNGLGETAHAAGRSADAITHHTAALTVAVDIGDREQQARAHTGLGRTRDTLAEPTLASHHYRHALALYTHLGTPEAELIRGHLRDAKHRHALPERERR